MSGASILQLGLPRKPIKIADLLDRVLREVKPPRRVRAGFAYASVAGVSAISISSTGQDWRKNAETQWVVSIDQGRTEPAGLEALLGSPNSELRLFLPRRRLDMSALFSLPRFHAKVLFAEAGRSPRPILLWAASANMTGAALGRFSSNYEFGFALTAQDGLSTQHRVGFLGWWEKVWESSIVATNRLISQYAGMRGEFLRRNPDVLEVMEQPVPRVVREAKALWIDAGAMSGGARNQIEFSRELAWFFGKPASRKRFVDMSIAGREFRGRPLTPKRTTFDVEIWRLGLPTNYDYAGKRVLFVRLPFPARANPRFELFIADRNDGTATDWFERAGRLGSVGATHGTGQKPARAYGYY